MRKIIVSEFVTLDGVMEDPGGSEKTRRGGWAFQFERGAEGDKFKLDETMEADAMLLGRVTYLGFAEAWPSRTGVFADKMNNMQKYVVSTTLKKTEWKNSLIISQNIPDEISKLKVQPGGPLLVAGSRRLVVTLLEHDLVDEFRLMVYPVVLGEGKRLFNDGSKRVPMRLVEAKPVGSGILTLIYHPDKNGASQTESATKEFGSQLSGERIRR
jgi:dihydrofolate reductase